MNISFTADVAEMDLQCHDHNDLRCRHDHRANWGLLSVRR